MSKERERFESIQRAMRCGLSEADAVAVRRIALTLHRWFELECGDSYEIKGGSVSYQIERDENTELPFDVRHVTTWRDGKSNTVTHRTRVPDRETGARKRLDKIMEGYPALRAFIQGDCRGGTIYLCKPEDATDSLYTRGVFIA